MKISSINKAVFSGVAIILLFLAGLAMTGCGGSSEEGADSSGGTPTATVDSDIVIPKGEVSAEAKFYPAEVDGTELEVIAVKAPDDTIRTAFNTCQVCYSSGKGYYKQEGDVLVCQNCGNQFSMEQVEVESGGCNPVPIFEENKKIAGDNITIPLDYLKEAKDIFANWKA